MWIIEQRYTVHNPQHSGTILYGPYLRLKSAQKAAKSLRKDATPQSLIRIISLHRYKYRKTFR